MVIVLKKPELLAPAGNMEKMQMALLYGADAVYLAGKSFGMRAQSGNFTEEELAQAVEFAHGMGKKVYVTVNIMPHNEQLELLPAYLKSLQAQKVDALIVSDLGVWRLIQEHIKDMPVHISTQANNVNWASALTWQEMGAERIVLARELSFKEIKEIRTKCQAQLEMFVHGAMCIAYSGRCLLSSYMTGRDANQGMCAQACRWQYNLVEEQRPGEYFPVFEDEHGTYVFNSRDLCLLEYLPQLIDIGVDSFKIEGRMKSVHYVATVVSVYRQAIDSYVASPKDFVIKQQWKDELAKISHRTYTNGFIDGKPNENGQVYTTSSYQQTHDFVGLVNDYKDGCLIIEQRNNVKQGETLEIIEPSGNILSLKLEQMFNQEGNSISVVAQPKRLFSVPYAHKVAKHSMLRRVINNG